MAVAALKKCYRLLLEEPSRTREKGDFYPRPIETSDVFSGPNDANFDGKYRDLP
jgi:hypothetical protein